MQACFFPQIPQLGGTVDPSESPTCTSAWLSASAFHLWACPSSKYDSACQVLLLVFLSRPSVFSSSAVVVARRIENVSCWKQQTLSDTSFQNSPALFEA